MTSHTQPPRPWTRLGVALGIVGMLAIGVSATVDAQVVQGVEKGAREGNKAAGPVGGVLGGAIGGVVGVVTGVTGVLTGGANKGGQSQQPAAQGQRPHRLGWRAQDGVLGEQHRRRRCRDRQNRLTHPTADQPLLEFLPAASEPGVQRAKRTVEDGCRRLVGQALEIAQNDARYVQPGQEVEVAFKFLPGQVFSGKVESVLQAIASGQMQTSGLAVQSKSTAAAPFVARIKLDDADLASRLPAGSTGTAAIFTDRVKAAHVIRKVLLRQIAILNYVWPF